MSCCAVLVVCTLLYQLAAIVRRKGSCKHSGSRLHLGFDNFRLADMMPGAFHIWSSMFGDELLAVLYTICLSQGLHTYLSCRFAWQDVCWACSTVERLAAASHLCLLVSAARSRCTLLWTWKVRLRGRQLRTGLHLCWCCYDAVD